MSEIGSFKHPMRFQVVLLLLGIVLLGSVVVSSEFGAARVTMNTVWQVILGRLFGLDAGLASVSSAQANIVWLIRVPRVLLGALVGAGLALVGAVLQAVTRNPLADPHLLGVTSGASLGAVTVILYLGNVVGMFTLPLAAFAGALIGLMLVLVVATRFGQLDSERLLLAGVAVSFVMTAGANLLLFVGDNRATASVLFWMMGGLGLARWELLIIPSVVIAAGGGTLIGYAPSLNALMTGDETAASLGLAVGRVRLGCFVIASLITGVIVAVSGSIGFVGLMVPHAARWLVGAEHRRLLPACALLGAVFMVWVDAVARTIIAPQDLPIGIATAAIGGISFIMLMRRAS